LSSLAAPGRRRSIVAIAGLGTTGVIGWGTAFTPLMVLGGIFARDLAVPRWIAFGGITVMLLVSALIATRVGAYVDKHGARRVMMTGSLVAALAMVVMSQAHNMVLYTLAWVLIGIAMPMNLNNTAMPGLVQVVGPGARRALTALMLITGLTSTVFLPIVSALEQRIGWRDSYLAFAALHVLVCLPIHALVLPRGAPATVRSDAPRSAFTDGSLPADKRTLAFAMLALWSCMEGLLTWGLNMQIIDVLVGLGLTQAAAIGVWMFTGPSQSITRFVDLLLGGRLPVTTTAVISAALAPVAFAILLLLGANVLTATAYCILFGIAHGFFVIGRNTLPLMLFGQRDYARMLGRLSLPQNIVNALAPIVFAGLLTHAGPQAAMILAAIGSLAGFVAVLILVRSCRAEVR
jgi:MFS family permease